MLLKAASPHEFATKGSKYHHRRQSNAASHALDVGVSLYEFYVGLAIKKLTDGKTAIGLALNDGTYSVDFAVHYISPAQSDSDETQEQTIVDLILDRLTQCQEEHMGKILGAGITSELDATAPHLASSLWAVLDIVPMVLSPGKNLNDGVDETADSVVRKCLMHFGPNGQPRLDISLYNEVLVDTGGRVRLTTLDDYQNSVREPTWRAVTKCVKSVVDRKIRIAFFSATPQGGGVALMRHALLRFLRLQGVHAQFVPKPRPDVFRITKTNHNILQGAVPPDVRATDEQLGKIEQWVNDNADRYWVKEKGPLLSPLDGGADIIIIDDPQVPSLIPIARKYAPERPIIFRSHIEVRDDLVQENGSAAQHVWSWMWANIKQADLFISHPVRSFVPSMVNKEKVGWMPATTDWLDGLNKDMGDWDVQYYLNILRGQCRAQGQPNLTYPSRGYIAQIARFDPSKGIPDVIKSYAKLRHRLSEEGTHSVKAPQLIICGHSSIDDPDGASIYDETMEQIHNDHPELKDDIIVLRLGPSDQLLNAVISRATVVLQLSTREGFEVKVSEALHKGKPVIATLAGGIPLQVEHGKSGFLVRRNDSAAVAGHLYDLLTDRKLYKRISEYAEQHVSDEVHTVGNALNWLHMAFTLVEDRKMKPNEGWINDLAREAAGEPYGEDEPRLPRHLST